VLLLISTALLSVSQGGPGSAITLTRNDPCAALGLFGCMSAFGGKADRLSIFAQRDGLREPSRLRRR
jgi:hypothetical protein